jgi:hypothetical protein
MMHTQPDWHALRRPLRACAYAALPLLAFLAFWQFMVPPGNQGNVLATWIVLTVVSLAITLGSGLSISASRRLWRCGRRARALLPLGFLPTSVVTFGWLGFVVVPGSLPLFIGCMLSGWLLASVLGAYLIVTTLPPRPAVAAGMDSPDIGSSSGAPAPIDNEPHAYSRDVDPNRKAG